MVENFYFQLVNKGTKENPNFCVFEVYLKDGKTVGFIDAPVNLSDWENENDLKGSIDMIRKDIEKHPCITYEELEQMCSSKN